MTPTRRKLLAAFADGPKHWRSVNCYVGLRMVNLYAALGWLKDHGYVEPTSPGNAVALPSDFYRITDAGRAALSRS